MPTGCPPRAPLSRSAARSAGRRPRLAREALVPLLRGRVRLAAERRRADVDLARQLDPEPVERLLHRFPVRAREPLVLDLERRDPRVLEEPRPPALVLEQPPHECIDRVAVI